MPLAIPLELPPRAQDYPLTAWDALWCTIGAAVMVVALALYLARLVLRDDADGDRQ